MAIRIIAKRWNNPKDQIITDIKLDDGRIFPVIAVWNDIAYQRFEFYTLEHGIRARVYANIRKDGTKYLTSHRDGITENNLDELPDC
jgi:hypothetical protein